MGRRANGEGSVYFDTAKGRWVAAVSVDGRRIKRSAKTKQAAVELKRRLEADAVASRGTRRTDAKTAWLLDEWERLALEAKASAPATVETKRWALRHLREQLGRTPLSRLGYADVERALARLAGEPHHLSKESLIKIRSTMNQVSEWGVRRGLLRLNPAQAAEIPAGSQCRKIVDSFSESEARRLLETAKNDPQLYGIVCTMLSVGLRPGEARALTWGAWNPLEETVAVWANVRVEQGKMLIAHDLKTASSRRRLKVPPETARAIESIRSERNARGLGSADSDLIFSTVTGRPIDASSFRRTFAALCDRAGVPNYSPNALRHTCASLLSDRGVPAERIADLLGHKDTRMVIHTYRKVLAPSIDVAATPMGLLFETLSAQ